MSTANAKFTTGTVQKVARGVSQPITGEGGKPPAPPAAVWNELTEMGGGR